MSIIMPMDLRYSHIMKYYPTVKHIKSATRSIPIQQQQRKMNFKATAKQRVHTLLFHLNMS